MWTVDCVFVRFVHFEPAVESEAMGIHGVQRHPKDFSYPYTSRRTFPLFDQPCFVMGY
ncbi:hypothetical protein M758_UG112100 [Ceratodon purpureus]|nr:hypothetical protein M758_UG112100 [Ceratodon purpureus]